MDRISKLGERFLGGLELRPRALVTGVIGVNFILTLLVICFPLQDFPNSGDEYAYQVSAQLFARGHLWTSPPVLPEFFDVVHVVNRDGRFYGKYPPGWPALLAGGYLLGAPWLLNPLLMIPTILLLFSMLRRHGSPLAGIAGIVCLLGNPFLIFNSASYFSHPACLFFVTLCAWSLFEGLENPGCRLPFVLLGLSAGAAVATRPFTAVMLLVPMSGVALIAAWRAGSGPPFTTKALLSIVPFLVPVGLFLAYNQVLTGSPFRQPFEAYDPTDVPGLPVGAYQCLSRARTHLAERLLALTLWLPLIPLLASFALARKELRGKPAMIAAAAASLTLLAGYFFYWGPGGFQYGPRYLYEASTLLVLLAAAELAAWRLLVTPLLLIILAINASLFVKEWDRVSIQVRDKKVVYTTVQEAGLQNALVFVRTGSGEAPVGDLPRNGIDFKGSVLFVRDLGPENVKLLREFPKRQAYFFDYHHATRSGRLTPCDPRSGRPKEGP